MEVTRYDPEMIRTDRWERASMEKSLDGDYVEFDDYEELRRERDAMAIYRDQGWAQAEKLEQEIAKLHTQLERAIAATNAECNDWAREYERRMKVTDEVQRLAKRCGELEKHNRERDQECARMLNEAWDERDTLRAEVERLTALQLPPDHLPMPRRMLELLIGDPQDPYRANAESVASEMLSGALPDPESHEREFSAVRNVRLLLSEIDRLRKVEERLSWMIKEGCWMHTGRKRDGELFYYLEWPDFMENQSDAFGDPMESIDAAMEASR